MHSTFKLTLAALVVSVVLTGCKSSQGASVIAKNANEKAVQLNQPTKKSSESISDPEPKDKGETKDKGEIKQKPETTTLPEEPEDKQQDNKKDSIQGNPESSLPTSSEEIIVVNTKIQPVNEDKKGHAWRVIPLSQTGSLINVSAVRADHTNYHLQSKNSPLGESKEFGETEYNYPLGFELGKNSQNNSSIKVLSKAGNNYLGQHTGTYQDAQLVGDSQKINYLYVNQPYSSYGALFTNAENSNLFHVQLRTGRDNGKSASIEENEEDSSINNAEYSVYSLQGKTGKWNSNLLGDAVYKGNVIARVEKQVNGKPVVDTPKVDGDVSLNLHLDNQWEESKLSGTINSKSVGVITLDEKKIVPAHAMPSYEISFSNTANAKDHEGLEGDYTVVLSGPTLSDAVGSIELENEDANDGEVSKYNAVFGAMKVEE